MTLLLDGRLDGPVRGCQTPRILSHPSYTVSSGLEVVELCSSVGMRLDPWQQVVLTVGLGERQDGKWSAFEVAEVVARQNGKGDVFMARELAGLFLFEERLLVHSAHLFSTCAEGFLRIRTLIENTDEFRRKCHKPRLTTGQEAIELLGKYGGGRLRFMARSVQSARGFTGDTILMDEAQILDDGPIGAMMPTLSTAANPQIWYAGTAGTPESVVLARARRRALAGEDASLAYLEWSVDEDDFDPADPSDWAKANPALGIRISEDYVGKERAAMSSEDFARERLGVGDWPVDGSHAVIPLEWWEACADYRGHPPVEPVVFAVEVNPERTAAVIAVAGRRPDGCLVVELADCRGGLDWVADRLVELDGKWRPAAIVVDEYGPAGTLVAGLEAAGLELVAPTSQEVAQSAEGFYDAVKDGSVRHRGESPLNAAVAGAKTREFPSGVWAWGRRSSAVDITPLVAASLALWAFTTKFDGLAEPDVYF